MREHGEAYTLECDLAFFGKITASFSHEINNIMSIINEYNGLLSDMVALAEQGSELDCGKVAHISRNMSRQLARGATIVKRLNKFAHSADEKVLSFDMSELLRNVSAFSQRYAGKKNLRIDEDIPQEAVVIVNNPFRTQHAVFLAFQLIADGAAANERITIALRREGDQVVVMVSTGRFEERANNPLRMDLLRSLLSTVEGQVEVIERDGGGRAFALRVANLS